MPDEEAVMTNTEPEWPTLQWEHRMEGRVGPLEWLVETRGDCEVEFGGAWCENHGSPLPSNRTPPYCNELIDVADEIERYVDEQYGS